MTNQDRCDALLDQIKSRSREEHAHALRVQQIAEILGAADKRLSDAQRSQLKIAAGLHDVGNLSISENVLYKNGRLDFDQYEEMQTHTALAEEYLKEFDGAVELTKIVRHHHENMNGFGYPDGLKGEAIPVESRIIHVAEALDSMVHRRNGAKGIASHPRGALAELQKYARRMYDATVVANAAAHLDDIQSIYDNTSA